MSNTIKGISVLTCAFFMLYIGGSSAYSVQGTDKDEASRAQAAKLKTVAHDSSMTGNGTTASPLSIKVHHGDPILGDGMIGDGTARSPLVLVGPIHLQNASSLGILEAHNNHPDGPGIVGESFNSGIGVFGISHSGIGIIGQGFDDTGVLGQSSNGFGVEGTGFSGVRGFGTGKGAAGVVGESPLEGTNATGVFGIARQGTAGFFSGRVHATGGMSSSASITQVDHPNDPANKYLYHAGITSPDMKNFYDGTVTTDETGLATVSLPEYFTAYNRDYRYQLTVVGQFAQAIIAEKIHDNRFTIKTDKPGVEVSWQVTGIRHDIWAESQQFSVEEEKPALERGSYLHPNLFGEREEKGVEWARYSRIMQGARIRKSQTLKRNK